MPSAGGVHLIIKLHKAQLASDRTSCRSRPGQPDAARPAYRRLLAGPRRPRGDPQGVHALAKAEFATIRLRLLKIAARVTESASRVRLAFAAAFPDAALFRQIAAALAPAPA